MCSGATLLKLVAKSLLYHFGWNSTYRAFNSGNHLFRGVGNLFHHSFFFLSFSILKHIGCVLVGRSQICKPLPLLKKLITR